MLRNDLIDSFIVLCIMVNMDFILPTNNYSVLRGIFSKICKQNSKSNIPEISSTILTSCIAVALSFRSIEFTFKFRSLHSREPFNRVTTSHDKHMLVAKLSVSLQKEREKKKMCGIPINERIAGY